MTKPILFNTAMVRAILAGHKTQTRRAIKPQYAQNPVGANSPLDMYARDELACFAPYCVGDTLWVRETWRKQDCNECPAPDYPCALEHCPCLFGNCTYIYAADRHDEQPVPDSPLNLYEDMRWRPSIHMPKDAARIFLRVTGVRAERLTEITDSDIFAEGIREFTKDEKIYKYAPADGEGDYLMWQWSECPRTPQDAFGMLWDNTVKAADREIYGYDANPWVWAYTFERIDKPQDF